MSSFTKLARLLIMYRFQLDTGTVYILVASNNATGAMRKFGGVLRTLYSKTPEYRKVDYSINYLG